MDGASDLGGPVASRWRELMRRGELDHAQLRASLRALPEAQLEAWVDARWGPAEAAHPDAPLPRGSVPYLPCPAATVLYALERTQVAADQVFVDLGSGLGRVAFMARLLTGAGAMGVELQADLVRESQRRADALELPHLRFIEGDASRLAERLALASVFFMYCPFSGEPLRRVQAALQGHARRRQSWLCCVDMPRLQIEGFESVHSERPELDLYRSRSRRG